MPATARTTRLANKAIGNPIERAIRTEKEYNATLREVENLLDLHPRKGSAEYDRLELLSILVEAYENENVESLPGATPQEVVEFMANQQGIDRTTLAELLGGRSRLSDFLNQKRQLSLGQIARLKTVLGIPADLLVG